MGVLQMKERKLLCSNEIKLEDSRLMKLDYSLTETYPEGERTTPYYGIHIQKTLEDAIEANEVRGISYARDMVVSMINTLFEFEVTPISMIEIIDDLVTTRG